MIGNFVLGIPARQFPREPKWGKSAYTLLLLFVTAAIALPAQTFTSLVSFNGDNGAYPASMSLVQGTNGDLYGTAAYGGAHSGGTVFKMTPSGTLITLYSFCAQLNCVDGKTPQAGLVLATNGTFYGTTASGGLYGDGTVFSVTAGGKLTTLHSFDMTVDGSAPYAALVQATNGIFYGTTSYGGVGGGDGTVFNVTSGGTVTTLHSFDRTDGAIPYSALVQGTNGNFYGTTSDFGANGYGTVFSITPGGTLTTLHNFDKTDGAFPYAPLVQATNGTFYSTTTEGGANGVGTVFSITSGGTLTTVHSFDSTDGSYPYAALVQATNGAFYGTTSEGGTANCSFGSPCGSVFSITAGGTLATLHSFDSTDGDKPQAALVQDTNGTFYGVTYEGGVSNYGTIFSLAVGLPPFVETLPRSGKVGKPVKILGTDLTGATGVAFNGTAATFTVVSKSEITTTVPTGATTGRVKVVTPRGTRTSNVNFRVPKRQRLDVTSAAEPEWTISTGGLPNAPARARLEMAVSAGLSMRCSDLGPLATGTHALSSLDNYRGEW